VAGPGNSFTSVSCASVSFCVVVGTAPDYNGYDDDLAVIYSNGTWSSNTSASVGPGDLLTSVSCAPDTEFCVAVGWADTGPGYTAISETYQDGTWTAHDDGTGYGSSGNQLISVSCASAHFCVDGGIVQQRSDLGDYLGIDYHSVGGGGQITDEQVDGLTGEIDAVSCAGDACLAAGNSSLVFSVRRTTWSGPTAPDGASTITALSCVTSSTCVAVDDNGDALTAGAGVWSAPQSVDPGRVLTAVSCPTVTFCAAVDNAGDVVVRS
jgi:hypothetical protein